MIKSALTVQAECNLFAALAAEDYKAATDALACGDTFYAMNMQQRAAALAAEAIKRRLILASLKGKANGSQV